MLVVVRGADGLQKLFDLTVLVSGTGWLIERPRLDLLRRLALAELGLLSTRACRATWLLKRRASGHLGICGAFWRLDYILKVDSLALISDLKSELTYPHVVVLLVQVKLE